MLMLQRSVFFAVAVLTAAVQARASELVPTDVYGTRLIEAIAHEIGSETIADASVLCDWQYGDAVPNSVVAPGELAQHHFEEDSDAIMACQYPAYGYDYIAIVDASGLVLWEENQMEDLALPYTPGNYVLTWQAAPKPHNKQRSCDAEVSVPSNTSTNYIYSTDIVEIGALKQSQWVKITYYLDDGSTPRVNCAMAYFYILPDRVAKSKGQRPK